MNKLKKLIALGLVCVTSINATVTLFAQQNTNGITIEGVYYTEEEFQNLLQNIQFVEGSNDNKEYPSSRMALAIPSYAVGEWLLPIIGTAIITVTPSVIQIGSDIIDSASQMFEDILNAIEEARKKQQTNEKYGGNKTRPTGKKVKNVHARLKDEGFEHKSTKSDHEKWNKDNKTVIVPNKGINTDIKEGTLHSIWEQAGWVRK